MSKSTGGDQSRGSSVLAAVRIQLLSKPLSIPATVRRALHQGGHCRRVPNRHAHRRELDAHLPLWKGWKDVTARDGVSRVKRVGLSSDLDMAFNDRLATRCSASTRLSPSRLPTRPRPARNSPARRACSGRCYRSSVELKAGVRRARLRAAGTIRHATSAA